MGSHNPTYGLWNDGEDEVKSRNKKSVIFLILTSPALHGRAKEEE